MRPSFFVTLSKFAIGLSFLGSGSAHAEADEWTRFAGSNGSLACALIFQSPSAESSKYQEVTKRWSLIDEMAVRSSAKLFFQVHNQTISVFHFSYVTAFLKQKLKGEYDKALIDSWARRFYEIRRAQLSLRDVMNLGLAGGTEHWNDELMIRHAKYLGDNLSVQEAIVLSRATMLERNRHHLLFTFMESPRLVREDRARISRELSSSTPEDAKKPLVMNLFAEPEAVVETAPVETPSSVAEVLKVPAVVAPTLEVVTNITNLTPSPVAEAQAVPAFVASGLASRAAVDSDIRSAADREIIRDLRKNFDTTPSDRLKNILNKAQTVEGRVRALEVYYVSRQRSGSPLTDEKFKMIHRLAPTSALADELLADYLTQYRGIMAPNDLISFLALASTETVADQLLLDFLVENMRTRRYDSFESFERRRLLRAANNQDKLLRDIDSTFGLRRP